MATKEQIRARQARKHMEEFVDGVCKRLHKEVEYARFELIRILAIAEKEHRTFAKPTRYFKTVSPGRPQKKKKGT